MYFIFTIALVSILSILIIRKLMIGKRDHGLKMIHNQIQSLSGPPPSLKVMKQGIGAVQSIFMRFRRATEDYLIAKGADISGNLSQCIQKAYDSGKITMMEMKNLNIMRNGGNIGGHLQEAEKYMKGQAKVRFRDALQAAKNLRIEIASYL